MLLDKVFQDVLVLGQQGRRVPWFGPHVCQQFGPRCSLLDLPTQGVKGTCVGDNLTPIVASEIGAWLISTADPNTLS